MRQSAVNTNWKGRPVVMKARKCSTFKTRLCRAAGLAALFAAGIIPGTAQENHDTLIVTSTNSATANNVVVFRLNPESAPSLSMAAMLPTGGAGGAGGNA